tara:strand:- start:91 stop:300 length:210 start_codon:yes stop_codon:yes gene_type:complete
MAGLLIQQPSIMVSSDHVSAGITQEPARLLQTASTVGQVSCAQHGVNVLRTQKGQGVGESLVLCMDVTD